MNRSVFNILKTGVYKATKITELLADISPDVLKTRKFFSEIKYDIDQLTLNGKPIAEIINKCESYLNGSVNPSELENVNTALKLLANFDMQQFMIQLFPIGMFEKLLDGYKQHTDFFTEDRNAKTNNRLARFPQQFSDYYYLEIDNTANSLIESFLTATKVEISNIPYDASIHYYGDQVSTRTCLGYLYRQILANDKIFKEFKDELNNRSTPIAPTKLGSFMNCLAVYAKRDIVLFWDTTGTSSTTDPFVIKQTHVYEVKSGTDMNKILPERITSAFKALQQLFKTFLSGNLPNFVINTINENFNRVYYHHLRVTPDFQLRAYILGVYDLINKIIPKNCTREQYNAGFRIVNNYFQDYPLEEIINRDEDVVRNAPDNFEIRRQVLLNIFRSTTALPSMPKMRSFIETYSNDISAFLPNVNDISPISTDYEQAKTAHDNAKKALQDFENNMKLDLDKQRALNDTNLFDPARMAFHREPVPTFEFAGVTPQYKEYRTEFYKKIAKINSFKRQDDVNITVNGVELTVDGGNPAFTSANIFTALQTEKNRIDARIIADTPRKPILETDVITTNRAFARASPDPRIARNSSIMRMKNALIMLSPILIHYNEQENYFSPIRHINLTT